MTFEDYVQIIVTSVCETGYEAFLPSLCLVEGEQNTMMVLEGDLSEGGEEDLSKEWAATFMNDESNVFLAFRSGQRRVTVMEYAGFEPKRKKEIKVNPPQDPTVLPSH